RRDLGELRGERYGLLARVPSRCEGQLLHLLRNGAFQARVAVADVMDVVAVEIHVATAGDILDPDALRLGNRIEARRRDGLAQEIALVFRQQHAGAVVEGAALPFSAAAGQVRIALGLGDTAVPLGHHAHGPPHRLRQACSFPNTSQSSAKCRSFTPSAVNTMSVAIPAAPAVKPASSMCTIDTEASFVDGPYRKITAETVVIALTNI